MRSAEVVNEYDQLLFRYMNPLLRPGERILFMGVARNDANLAGQVALVALVGVKIVPPMFFLVSTDQKLVAFKCPGLKFSGAPRAEIEGAPTILEYRACQIKSIGTTALGGKDLYLVSQAGEHRFNIVSSLANLGSSNGPSLQNQLYAEFTTFLPAMYQEGFARVAQVPDVNARFAMIQEQNQRIAAHKHFQDNRKKNGTRTAISAVSIVVMVVGFVALGVTGLAFVEYRRCSGFKPHAGTYVPYQQRELDDLKSGKMAPLYGTKESRIASLEGQIAKDIAERKKQDQHSAEMLEKATSQLTLAGIVAAAIWILAIGTRIWASKLPKYADERPGAAGGAAPPAPNANPSPQSA